MNTYKLIDSYAGDKEALIELSLELWLSGASLSQMDYLNSAIKSC